MEMPLGDDGAVRDRLHERALLWRVRIDDVFETASSVLGIGFRDEESVVLKVIKREGDEWRSGDMLHAFDGRGVVRALASEPGAMLLERLTPGTSLIDIVLGGDDDRATEALADVIAAMSPADPPPQTPTVEDWSEAFDWYAARDTEEIERALVRDARDVFRELSGSQSRRRLLHGDLQHSNVLYSDARGWTAIDPKGVVGEPEYELGAFIRNPVEAPGRFTDLVTVERRLRAVCSRLTLDYERALHWAFAQAVLSAIWCVQDDGGVSEHAPVLTLARAMWPRVRRRAPV